MVYFTSDQHFGHKNIIKLCGRPFDDLHHMHKTLSENWNKIVQPEDTVWVLGDFCFGNTRDLSNYISKLNGKLILVAGNHDKLHEISYLKAGFNLVLHRAQIKINKYTVNISHYPYLNSQQELDDAKEKGYKIKFLDKRPIDDGNWLLHGHTHKTCKVYKRMINVGVDAWNFKPVSVSTIESIIMKKEMGYIGSEEAF